MDSSADGPPALHLRTVQVLLWEAISPKIRAVERDEVSTAFSGSQTKRAREREIDGERETRKDT